MGFRSDSRLRDYFIVYLVSFTGYGEYTQMGKGGYTSKNFAFWGGDFLLKR